MSFNAMDTKLLASLFREVNYLMLAAVSAAYVALTLGL